MAEAKDTKDRKFRAPEYRCGGCGRVLIEGFLFVSEVTCVPCGHVNHFIGIEIPPGWATAAMRCALCGRKWLAIRPKDDLEAAGAACPDCHRPGGHKDEG